MAAIIPPSSIYRADYLVTMAGPPLAGGWMRVRDGRVEQTGDARNFAPRPGEALRDFSGGVLLPGLINAHCHLELGMARGLLPRGNSFSAWVSDLRKALAPARAEDFREAARLGALECLRHGTTTVVDVGNSGESLRELAQLPIRSFAYLELLGLDPARAADLFRSAVETSAEWPEASDRFRPGIACHAPYSCSEELLRLVGGAADRGGVPFTVHAAESAEESALFRDGTGDLLAFCRRVFPGAHERPGTRSGPIRFLGERGLIPPGALLAHCNDADADDARLLAACNASVAHCPRSRAFFGHPGFSPETLREAGVNICLGTDSLASNEGLNLFDEMAEFKSSHPRTPCRDILEMATVNGGRALGREDLGSLRPGSRADFIALDLRHGLGCDLYEEIVLEEHEVALVVVDGEEVVS